MAAAQEAAIRIEQHPWGRFPVGSWKTVRVISETLDDDGNVANITTTDTRSTLVAADTKGFTLKVEVTVEVAGKRFVSQPQLAKHGYFGEIAGEPLAVKKTGDAELTINGVKVPCELQQLTLETAETKRVSTLHYSNAVFPYIMRRETTTTDGPDAKPSSTLVEVVATGPPEKVLGELKPAAFVKTVRNGAGGSSITMEVQCHDVPGGVVSHSAQEMNPAGRTIRRSTLELLDYSIGNGQTNENPLIRRRKFHRRTR